MSSRAQGQMRPSAQRYDGDLAACRSLIENNPMAPNGVIRVGRRE